MKPDARLVCSEWSHVWSEEVFSRHTAEVEAFAQANPYVVPEAISGGGASGRGTIVIPRTAREPGGEPE